jgi:hypothetical protein
LGNSNIFSDDEKSKILKRKSNPSSPFTWS